MHNPQLTFNDRIESMLMASAVADALAGPHEGRPTQVTQRLLHEGCWQNTMDGYSKWYQSHWNVYQRQAIPGTVTDDTRLRTFITDAMIHSYKDQQGKLTKEYLAQFIYKRYRRATEIFEAAVVKWKQTEEASDIELLKERFLHQSFMWELVKVSTEVMLPGDEPPLLSPAFKRSEILTIKGQRSGEWKLEAVEPFAVRENIKTRFNDDSYERLEEWPIGLIALPPMAIYFPGSPAEAFQYIMEFDFFDIPDAHLYAAVFTAILADLLNGKPWPEMRSTLWANGLAAYFNCPPTERLSVMERNVADALAISEQFMPESNQIDRDRYTVFVETLHERFADGEVMMCRVDEMLPVTMAMIDYCTNLDLNNSLECAVNYGRDNDTLASLVGLLAGAQLDQKSIKEDWMQAITNANTNSEYWGVFA